MVKRAYIPVQGDLVWLNFNPQAGREQAGKRPAICVSLRRFNEVANLALFCPITSRTKGLLMEVPINSGKISGAVLCDHIKSFDYKARQVQFIARADDSVLSAVCDRVRLILA